MTEPDTAFFKVVIVGHVDHGKSTLIGRLLYDTGSIPPDKLETVQQACDEIGQPFEYAYITDQIREERTQGITMDTTQIYFRSAQRDYAIIDAPGHKEFTHNMLTGASQAEGAILVIDAREGVREQTRRHAYLLAFLGLKQNIVVINKMDLVEYCEDTYRAIDQEIASFFQELDLPMARPIPIVAASGDNLAAHSPLMPWYAGPTLLDALDALPKPALTEGPFRLPVQDVYAVQGERIVVGRIESGRVAAGDRVLLAPGAQQVTVSSVREYGCERQDAECGESIGLIVDGATDIRRGQMLTARASAPRETRDIHGTICWLSRDPLQLDEPLTFRCNTQEVACTVSLIQQRMDSSSLELCEEQARCLYETEIGVVRIAAAQPVLIEPFAEIASLGRFVLERHGTIVAGGVSTC